MMVNIHNKKESLNFIKSKNLNHFGEVIISKGDINKVNEFFENFDVSYYYLRELKAGTKNVFYTLTKEEVYEKLDLYENFGLDVSSLNYTDNIKFVGEIFYSQKGELLLSGSINPNSTHRKFLEPNYFYKTTIFDKRVNKVPYIKEIFDYIVKHNLFEYIIEFVVFDIPVGIKKEKIIIYEIRNKY